MSRRAKIVCTLGPATSGRDQIAALVAAGLDVARLNMSHGSQDSHPLRMACPCCRGRKRPQRRVLVDLQGPKIRLGRFASGPVTLVPGAEFTITGEDVPGEPAEVSTTYRDWPVTSARDPVLVDDGRVVLDVTAVAGRGSGPGW